MYEELEELANVGNAQRFYEKMRRLTKVSRPEHTHEGIKEVIWSAIFRVYCVYGGNTSPTC